MSKDIQKMLKSTKAYVKHVKGPPVMSKATMDKLSVPQATRMHAEHQLCLEQGLKDHISYAEYKANKLQQQHSREEAQQHHRQLEADTRNQNLAAYRAAKQQVGGMCANQMHSAAHSVDQLRCRISGADSTPLNNPLAPTVPMFHLCACV